MVSDKNSKKNSRLYPRWPWWRLEFTGLTALALALSSYLGWHQLAGGSVIGCGGGSPCDQALNSRWSSVAGVLPVSGLAAGTYLALLVASFFIGPATEAPVRRLAWRAILVLAGAIAGSAAWFTIIQTWIIGDYCPYCMATHITGLLLAALVIWRAPGQFDDGIRNPISETNSKSQSSDFGFRIWVLPGLASVGVLATSQIIFTPPDAYRSGDSRGVPLSIDPHAAPLIGSPDAPYIVNLLFDYKCPHCQQLHLLLDEAVRRYEGKLAFVLCPTPLNTNCNPYVRRNVDEFKDSCELAKVGLAVWMAKREAFLIFDRWMFSFESGDRWQPRSLDAAKSKAVELVGKSQFESAATDPWINQHLQASVQIYVGALQGGNAAVPKLVFGRRWVIPEPNDADDLMLILQNSLAVPKR